MKVFYLKYLNYIKANNDVMIGLVVGVVSILFLMLIIKMLQFLFFSNKKNNSNIVKVKKDNLKNNLDDEKLPQGNIFLLALLRNNENIIEGVSFVCLDHLITVKNDVLSNYDNMMSEFLTNRLLLSDFMFFHKKEKFVYLKKILSTLLSYSRESSEVTVYVYDNEGIDITFLNDLRHNSLGKFTVKSTQLNNFESLSAECIFDDGIMSKSIYFKNLSLLMDETLEEAFTKLTISNEIVSAALDYSSTSNSEAIMKKQISHFTCLSFTTIAMIF